MGQGASKSSTQLARADVLQLFAARCSRLLQPIEVVSLSNNFKQYASMTDDTQYWNQDTLTNFLDIPESAKVSNLLYKSVLFLASFPFIQNYSTAAVTYESLIKVIAFYTKRLNGILKSDYDFVKLYFCPLRHPKSIRQMTWGLSLKNSNQKRMIWFLLLWKILTLGIRYRLSKILTKSI